MLDQTLETLKSCKSLAQTRLDALVDAQALNAINAKLIERYLQIIKDSDERIKILEKQKCSTISVLWGLIKFKQC